MNDHLLEIRNIHKKFPGVHALKGVSFSVKSGEVHALVGENGAGKSTLIKILAGIFRPDEGEILLSGEVKHFKSVFDSQACGIRVIHQELSLVPHMTVAENIFLGKELHHKAKSFLKTALMNRQAQEILDKLGLPIQATEKVAHLSIANQQMVEIGRALSSNADMLIMDEPTSSLTDKEIEILFQIIRNAKANGVSVIYISHKLDEVKAISDRITVIRDGEYIGTEATVDMPQEKIISMMVGRELQNLYTKNEHIQGEKALEVKNLSVSNVLKNINLTLYKGEILGLAGLVGAGRTELAKAIFGLLKPDSGDIFVNGQKCKIASPTDALGHGLALIPENRKEQGLILNQSVSYNITLNVLKEFITGIRVNKKVENELVRGFIDKLKIKTSGFNQLVVNLSGGNQQKTILAKWLATKPVVLILDEPTRGIDVGSKAEIYRLMNELANEGVSILLISSELPEIIYMSDRILVIRNGEIAGELNYGDISQERIMQFATGSVSL